MKGYFPGLTYVEHSSLIHSIHPLVKLVLLFSFNITVFAIPSLKGGGVLFGLLLIFYGFSGLGFTFFYRKLRLIFFFGLFIFLVQVFAVKEGALLLYVSLGRISFGWSEGLWGGLNMMLRLLISLLPVIFL